MTLDGTTNSKSFILYLLILSSLVKMSFKNIEFPIIWVVNNSTVHTTENTKSAAKHKEIEINLLPPYWPHLAPVERIFGWIKKKIWREEDGHPLNFSKASGKRAIANVLKAMKPSMPIILWLVLIRKSKEIIIYSKGGGNAESKQIRFSGEEENNSMV